MVESYRHLEPSPEWERLLSATAVVTRIKGGSWWKTWRELHHKEFDSTIVFFTGEKGFLRWKILPFLLPIPQTLIVNEHGECFYSGLPDLIRFWYRRLRHGVPLAQTTLVIQSDDSASMRQVLKTLHERRPMAHSSVAVFCRGEDRSLFAFSPGVEKIFTYRPGQWRQNLRVAQQLRRLRASVVATHLSGKPTFRLHKLLFFLIPAGRRLAVNENLDCFYAGRSALVRFFLWRVAHPTRPPLVPMTTQSRVLLIQTEDLRTMVSTLDVLLEPHVAPRARVTVYCREDAREILGAHSAVHRILTYGPGGFRKKLTSLWDAVRSHPDIVAAVFSRRPIFRLHRILFLLLPARNRLVFNENIDCYFLNRATLAQLFRRREKETMIRFVMRATLIPLIRKLLFFPRFAYLLGWLGLQQLSRHYRLRHRR